MFILFKRINDETLEILTENLKNILDLDIAKCALSEQMLNKCLQKMKFLQKLRLPKVTDNLIKSLSQFCPNLRDIFVPKSAVVKTNIKKIKNKK